MKCPECKITEMVPVLTGQGVEIDCCPDCKGIWLDRGEIYYFTKNPLEIQKELNAALKQVRPSARICPRTGKDMKEIKLLKGKLILDYSPYSGGIWFDEKELQKLLTGFGDKFKLNFDQGTLLLEGTPPPIPVSLPPLPNLFIRSTMVLGFLYAFLALILITLTFYTDLTPFFALVIGIGITVVQFLFGPVLTDLTLSWFYKMHWVDYEDLPVFLANFIKSTCRKNKMNSPRIGIISDGAPNAFTYGHTPDNARIILTQGLIALLNEDEVKGVVAHEIGHAKHWDMLIMTAAQLIPLILYYIYRTLIRIKTRDKSNSIKLLIAITSYVLYLISEYLVLWLSRTREYYADRFAGEATNDPNCLASALVKIGYGLAGKEKKEEKEEQKERMPGLEAIKGLGIFDLKSGLALLISSVPSISAAKKMGGEIDRENLKGAMKWDLWNPWAKYYELNSTHPLLANRINNLSKHSEFLGKEPFLRFDERKPESYWDEFIVDIFIRSLPLLVIIGFAISFLFTHDYYLISIGITALGFAGLLNTRFSYKLDFFPEMLISGLLKKVKVSYIRPVPCKIKGTVIGRGVPGLIWSEDFIMQDETGIIFLDYSQPIPLWDFFFGILKRAKYNNQEAEVTGWFRRAPVPYIEVKTIRTKKETEIKCYTYIAKYIWAGILIIAGIIGLFLTSLIL